MAGGNELDQLNSVRFLYLRDLSEPRDNSLRLLVQEAIVNRGKPVTVAQPVSPELTKLLDDAAPIESTEVCRTFELIRHRYVAYWVAEECAASCGTHDEEIFTGKLFRVYTSRRWGLLLALLAGTGLRIGEALGLKHEDLSEDCTVLHVRRSIWQGHEQGPKTSNAVRVVDIPESLAQVLRENLPDDGGYVFHTNTGTPLLQRNALRALHATGLEVGFHAFRRFRTETLRRERVPEDLTKLWLGHAKQTMTDLYADGLRNDTAWRSQWCERVGLGFSINGLRGLQNFVPIDVEKVA